MELKINFGKQMRKEIQLRFHNIVSNPALLYGSECWTLRQRDKSRINSSQMRFIRSLIGVTLRDRIKIEKIRKQFKVQEIINDIPNYQQKWNQHVLRMPENRLLRKSLQYQPQGKRYLGTLPSLEKPIHVVAERELITQNCEWKKKKKKNTKTLLGHLK